MYTGPKVWSHGFETQAFDFRIPRLGLLIVGMISFPSPAD
jgi:hypothetical protein